MRAGFMISELLDTLTGGYIYDRQLVEYLRQKGHEVELIPLPGSSYLSRWLNNPRLPRCRKLTQLSMDILIQDELDHPSLILLNRKLKDESGFPIISIVHNLRSSELRPAWQNKIYRQIEKEYLKSVDGFVFNSHTTRLTVENLLGRSKPGIIAYPCGNRLSIRMTESEIKHRARSPGPLRILFLGNLLKNKGLHVLLDALAKLPEDGCILTAAGDLTMDRRYVRKIYGQIREYRMSNRTRIPGQITGSELEAILKESHVLAVPSFYEGFGMAYLEGMGAGLPAIGTTAGAAKEIITPGQNGYLISPGDSTGLAQYLLELSQDRGKLEEMSLKALQRFKSHPEWQTTCEKILNFLQSMSLR